jgi:hypothetical protein
MRSRRCGRRDKHAVVELGWVTPNLREPPPFVQLRGDDETNLSRERIETGGEVREFSRELQISDLVNSVDNDENGASASGGEATKTPTDLRKWECFREVPVELVREHLPDWSD